MTLPSLRILFVEDQPDTIKPAVAQCKAEGLISEHLVATFEEAEPSLVAFSPHVVVLDILEQGEVRNTAEGLSRLELIWRERFCPVVVYSAQPELVDKPYVDHPFVKLVTKGADVDVLISSIREIQPHALAIRDAESKVRQLFAEAMTEASLLAFSISGGGQVLPDTLLRASRRRLAALMHATATKDAELNAWEQYLSPPVDPDTKLGDVLRVGDGNHNDPSAYRLVLSPSCDLATGQGRKPRDQALVAKCVGIPAALSGMGLKANSETIEKHVLPSGSFNGYFPLPSLTGRIPAIAAHFRDIELIPSSEISSEDGATYLRVASLDSPFRELVAWSYMLTACRPGLPDRDIPGWIEEIKSASKEDAS